MRKTVFVTLLAAVPLALSVMEFSRQEGRPTRVDPNGGITAESPDLTQPNKLPMPPAIGAFGAWLEDYAAAPAGNRASLLADGERLLAARMAGFGELILADPAAALRHTPTPRMRALLPAAWEAMLERIVTGEGFYGVKAICHHDPSAVHGKGCRIEHEVLIGGRNYRAAIYGERRKRKTEARASIYGVAVGDRIALHEDDCVVHEPEEMPSGAVPEGGYAVTYKGETSIAANAVELKAQISGKLTPAVELPLAAAGPVFDPETPPTGPTPPTVAYNEYTGSYQHQKGPKTVFVFLIEPSDGAAWSSPPSFATYDSQLNSASQNFYNVSYRQTWFGPKYKNPGAGNEVLVPRLVVSPVVRLARTTSELIDALSTQAYDAKALVEALGGDYTNGGPKDPDNFDRWVVMSNTKLVESTGLAYVGGAISWTGGALSGGVPEHEFGHNWGVVHANSWNVPEGAQPRATSGSNGEYSDGWDLMGGGGTNTGFNTLFQEELGFLERSRGEVLDVTASGSYRLYDYIDPYSRNVTANRRALLLPMSSFTDNKRVFLGFGHITGTDGGTTRNDWNRNAITVHSGLSDGSNRIDTTPYSLQANDANDSAIKIGRTYTEGANVNGTQVNGGFSVTPVQRGNAVAGATTHEWMDVVINYGAASPNAPVASFSQSTYAATAGAPLAVSITASDPDGDSLAYDWNFGDGTYSITNSATQTKTWNASGLYLVTCTVSDMKGKTTAANCWVNVGNIAYRTPENPPSTLAGLYYRYYEGTFSTMPNFATLLPVKSGTTAAFDLSPRNRNDNFAFQFEGFIDVPANDIYTFKTTSDDGSRLYIGNTLVVDSNAVQSAPYSKTGNIALDAGKHKIRVEFFHKDGGESLTVAWSTRTTSNSVVPSGSLSQSDPSANAAPVVSISQPLGGASFLVNSDILLQANATDADGVTAVVFFADGSYLGTDTTAPYAYSWPKVSVGAKSLVAVATDSTGRWAQSAAVAVAVVSPAPQPSTGMSMNAKNVAGGSMFFNDVSGGVYQQQNWNNLTGLSGAVSTVKDYLGNTLPMAISWVGSANDNYGDGSNDADTSTGPGRMFKGLAEIRGDETNRPTLTAANVPYPQYDVYVYFDLRGNDAKDTLPMRFICTPTEGASPADVFGKNSLSSSDAVGDYPVYDTWVGFKEATATTAAASNDVMLGNYVVFRNLRSSGFTMRVERQTAATQQRLGFSAVQIVRSNPTAPAVILRQTGGNTAVTEGGAGDSYSLALGYAPDSNVTITVTSGGQLTASPSILTFTPQNWSAPQPVAVAAVNDSTLEGAHTGTITHAVSSSGNYSGVTIASLTVSITDDDLPVVSVRTNGKPVESASPTAASYQIARGGVGSLAAPLTVAFQMSGITSLSADYSLSDAAVSYNSSTGAGTVTIPAGHAQVFLRLTPLTDALLEGAESAILTVAPSAAYAAGSPGTATLSIADDDVADYFTEAFESAAAFDLNGKSITFSPATGNYTAGLASVTAYPSGTSGFTNFNNSTMAGGTSDDGWWSQSLAVAFPYFGVNHTTAYVLTNGCIIFGAGESLTGSAPDGHFRLGVPRISGIMRDLNPGAGGNVAYKRDTTAGQQRSIFYWNAVRNYNLTTTVSFQIELFDDGRIRITWLNSTPSAASVAGLSSGVAATMPTSPYDGTGANPFYESDLSGISAAAQNTAPTFASIPVTLATVGQAFSHAIACADLENNPLTLTAPTKPAWLTLTNYGDGTATLSGTPVASGTYPVVLQVTDGTTAVPQSFTLMVIPSGGNSAPQFASAPTTQATAGAAYSYVATATDADGHALSFSTLELPGWLTLVDHGNGSATLAGAAPDTGVQSHSVALLVSDGLNSTTQAFSISLNRAPVIVLQSPAAGFVELPDRAVTLELDAAITDDALPVGSNLTAAWSIVSGPGSVSFGSPSAAVTTAKFSAAGLHILRLTAFDGSASSSRDVQVFVEHDGDAVAANGLQGWWKFDEGTGSSAADSSGNARTLTLTSATMSADGYAGKAYTGDATATQSAGHATFAAPTLITMSAWVYANASPATNERYIFNFHTSSTSRLRLYMANGTSRLRFFADRSTDGLWEAQYNVPAQQWFHVTVSYDTSSAAADPVISINGGSVLVGEIGAAPTGAQVASAGFSVGGNNSTSNSWSGRIDEARVYNRLLPAAEIPLLALIGTMNAAPQVNAGADADTAVGAAFGLAGTASDDGAPLPLALTWSQTSGVGSAEFGNASAAATTVSWNTAGSNILRLTADDGAVRVFDEVTITTVASSPSFVSWIAGFPAVGSLTNPTNDPDGDGCANLVEYALGTDPAAFSLMPASAVVTESSNRYLQIQWTRPDDRDDVTTVGEVASDLSGTSWSSSPAVVSTTITPSGAGMETVTIRLLEPVGTSSRRFLRARVILPP